MKKTIWIASISFSLGIFLAGMIFVYFPEKNSPESLSDETSYSSSSLLYASSPPQVKPDLDFVKIADKVGPAVVRISSEIVEKKRVLGFGDEWPFDDFWDRFFGIPREREQEFRTTAAGTGFLISPDGYIVTNYHLVEKAEKVTIFTLQDKEYKARIVGTDPKSDLALLKVDDKNLPYTELGDSARLKVGEWVLAIGNPLGFEHTVSAGIVSAKGRQIVGSLNVPDYQDYIQTDAAINRGNSGGPLVNMKGEVIGITSIIASPTGGNIGIGFAIPSNLAKKVVTQLKEKGRVVRGYLGIKQPRPITEEIKSALKLKSKKGVFVTDVDPGTPAEKAGIERYDVIVELDGQPIKDHNDLAFKIAEIAPGTKVEIRLIREGKEKIVSAKLVELEPEEEQATSVSSGNDLGFEWTTLNQRIVRQYRLETQEGAIINEVRRYSEAERKGLEVGDIIIEANRQKINNKRDLENILKKLKPGDGVILLVRREIRRRSPQEFIVTLRIPE